MNYLGSVTAAACQVLGGGADQSMRQKIVECPFVQATLQWAQGKTWERQMSLKTQPPPAASYPVYAPPTAASLQRLEAACSCPLMLQGPSCIRF